MKQTILEENWFIVAESRQLRKKPLAVSINGVTIVVYRNGNELVALKDTCPHRGAPLGEGRIEEGILICPNHEWRFELKSGWCPQNPELSTEVYPIKVHDGKIYVRLEKPKVEGAAGSAANSLPSDIKFKIPTILKPRNPDEEL